MQSYVEQVRDLEAKFQSLKFEQISREKNQEADFLAKIGSSLMDC